MMQAKETITISQTPDGKRISATKARDYYRIDKDYTLLAEIDFGRCDDKDIEEILRDRRCAVAAILEGVCEKISKIGQLRSF